MERGSPPSTRHTLEFDHTGWTTLAVIPAQTRPLFDTVAPNQRNPDKTKLKETILALRAAGWSYREIAEEVGLHWTRVGQVLKSMRTGTG